MKFIKKLKIAFGMLKNAKLRSWLTIIGIVIAVASVTMILSFGEGINNEVQNKLGSSGIGIYSLTQGFHWSENQIAQNTKITLKDYEFLEKIDYVDMISRQISFYSKANYFGEEYEISVTGVDLENFDTFQDLTILKGEKLQEDDIGVIILSTEYINQSFQEDFKPQVGDYLEIGTKQFLIIGIYDSNDFFSFSFNNAFISFIDAKQLRDEKIESEKEVEDEYDEFGNLKTDIYDSIMIKFTDEFTTEKSKEKLNFELDKFRDSDSENPNYNLNGKDDALGFINKIVDVVTWVLVGFASISIIVGSVGVANTMYTSVIEKTKEIGIMKAIGAKDNDIEHIFLLNSGLLGLAGGIIGVAIGLTLALIGGVLIIYLSKIEGISLLSLISFKIIFGSLLFSILIGMVSGYFPAKNAAAQDPVIALRGE